jgi:Polyketide cyclase / dehydrase and lipid transport
MSVFRQQLDHDEASIVIDAPPEAVYAVVSDVTRTPEYSPEVVSCQWLDGADGPRVGARFVARNSVGRGPAWSNRPVVNAAEPGREFAFARTETFAGTVEWRYLLSPEGAGTRVVESYDVTAPLTWLGWFIIGGLYGRGDRREDLRTGMARSLERLKRVVETTAPTA